jgi:hypothetical protein
MFDCVDDVLAYHDDKVTLAQAERTEMRAIAVTPTAGARAQGRREAGAARVREQRAATP